MLRLKSLAASSSLTISPLAPSGRWIVVIEALVKHPQYGKYTRTRTKLAVHDPTNAAAEGDVVEIAPCRRMSKTKCWRLVRVVRQGVAKTELPTESK